MSQFQAAKAQITRARSLRTRPRLIMQTLNLPPELHAIFEQDIPRFSNDEYQRRHNALARVMESAGIDHLLVVTAHHAGNATRWIPAWPGTIEALLIFRPAETMTMFV